MNIDLYWKTGTGRSDGKGRKQVGEGGTVKTKGHFRNHMEV